MFDLLMGEPETPRFHDFEIFERVPGSQNQFIFGDPKTPQKIRQK